MRRVQNLTPKTYSATNGKKRKRSRPPLSCQPCRLSKVACDRKKPCSSCSRQARPGSCVYVDPGTGDGNVITNNSQPTSLDSTSTSSRGNGRIVPPIATTNEDRMGRIEKVVESLASETNSAHTTPPVIPTAFQQPKNATASAQSEGGSKHSAHINPHSEEALVTKTPGTIYYIGRNGWTLTHHDKRIMFCGGKTFADQWAAFGEVSKRFKGWRSHNLLHCTLAASTKK
ncbi:hypothetical protein BDV97DRAFT_66328 [Delphinella strobiligena]|nr:hypothetical protein BDV97DRAFT_66328 [Delphinella strobiligena]